VKITSRPINVYNRALWILSIVNDHFFKQKNSVSISFIAGTTKQLSLTDKSQHQSVNITPKAGGGHLSALPETKLASAWILTLLIFTVILQSPFSSLRAWARFPGSTQCCYKKTTQIYSRKCNKISSTEQSGNAQCCKGNCSRALGF